MLQFGSLTPTAIGYYTAVATVIPVLLVAAVVQLAAFGRQAFKYLAEATVAVLLAGIYSNASSRLVSVIVKFTLALIFALLGLLLALIMVPAAGETAAFVALSRDGSSSLDRFLTVSGLVASGLAVVISMALTIGSAVARWADDLGTTAAPTEKE